MQLALSNIPFTYQPTNKIDSSKVKTQEKTEIAVN